MKSVAALVGALERGDASPAPRRILTRLVWTVEAVILLALLFGLSLYGLWKAWQTGDWFNFQFSALIPGMLLFLGLIFGVPVLLLSRTMGLGFSKAQMQESTRALRDIAALGDDRLAPPTILQPAPLASGELPMAPARIGPLKQPALATANGAGLFGTILGPLFTLVAFIPLLAVFFGEDFGSSVPLGGFFPLIYLIWFPLFFVPIVLRARRGGPSVFVSADEAGVSWQRPGRSGATLRIRWDEVRSLSRIGYSGYGGTSSGYNTAADWERTSYMLDAAGATLVWTISSTATDAEVAASELLLRLAVTRAGKPLRNLSAIAAELARVGGNVARVLAGRTPVGSTTPVLPNLATPSIPAQPDKRRRAKVALWIAAGLVLLLLFGGLYGAGFWLQQYQPHYYANLPAQVHARQPLYHDDLAAPTGDWPVQQSTSSDFRGFAYVNGAYQLSGNVKGKFLVALGPKQYGDAAVEVTATLTGELTQDGGDGIGIVVHSDANQNEFLTFFVGYNGAWQLMHYKYVDNRASDNWNGVADGQSSAINNAPGGVNHLLLISRGNLYLFYINGQFVSSENVRYETIPGSGYAGVYLDDTALTGTFSSFSVYPVQPVAPWDIV